MCTVHVRPEYGNQPQPTSFRVCILYYAGGEIFFVILHGVCYLAILFCRIILCSPPCLVSRREFRPVKRAVLMGTKSCTKVLNFSTRFSCENLAVEDFVTLLMEKKSC